MPDPSSEINPLDKLAEEFVERYRRGERPGLAEYIQRHPELEGEIRDLFPGLVLMEGIRPETGEATGAYADLPAPDKRPERIGDYRILREVGRGGMGIVYEAEQESLGRHVALKVLPSHALLDTRHLQRFQREARSAARLHHTNIVPVYGIGSDDGLHYYVMQFIQGQGLDLVLGELKQLRKVKGAAPAGESGGTGTVSAAEVAQALLTGRSQASRPGAPAPDAVPDAGSSASHSSIQLPGQSSPSTLSDTGRPYWQSVARLGIQVADALAYAHGQGTFHRDIKPSNLLLDGDGVVWVTDFGLAKASADTEDLTHTGDIVGTLRYMAPERFQGQSDVRGDIYSLGLTLYEMLTLRPAFQAGDRNKLIQQVMNDEPERPRKLNAAVPRDLETIVLKAIDRDPARRYQNAAEMSADLKRFVEDRPIQARRVTRRERLWRWCHRNPAMASLLALLFIVLSVGLAGVTWKWREAEHLRQEEQTQREAKDVALEQKNIVLGEKDIALKEVEDARKAAVAAEKLAGDRADQIQQNLDSLSRANQLVASSQIAQDEGRWGKAEADLSEAIRLRPDMPELWKGRAEIYGKLGLWDLAGADYTRARSMTVGRSEEWYNYAFIQRFTEDIEGYRNTCKRMLETFRDAKDKFHVTAVCALDPDPVVAPTRLVAMASELADKSNAPWHHWTLGLALYRAGNYTAALRTFQKCQQLNRDWDPAWVLPFLAMAQHRLRQDEAARKTLEEADKAVDQWIANLIAGELGWTPGYWLDVVAAPHFLAEAKELLTGVRPPEDPRWWVIRGRSLAAVGRLDQAQAEFARAIKARPRDVDVRMTCFRSYVDQKQWDKADVELAAAAKLKPDDTKIWATAFGIYAQQGQRERADAALEQVAKKSPNAFMEWLFGAFLYAGLGDLVAARAAQERATAAAVAASLPNANVLSLGLAVWYLEKQEWDKAEAEYQRQVAKWPKDDAIRMFYAKQLMLKHRDYSKAVALFEEATQLKPDNAQYWNELAVGHVRMENFDKAIEAQSRAIEIDPKTAQFWVNRGFVNAELGRWKDAAADYAKAVELQPGNPSLRETQALCCLSAGMIAEYKQACAQLAQKAEQSEVQGFVVSAVQASKFAVDSLPEWSRMLPIFERLEAANQNNASYYALWAVANYRAGNFAEAQRKLIHSTSIRGTPLADDFLFTALIHHQLGDANGARRAFNTALHTIHALETKKPALPGSPPTRVDFNVRQHYALLTKEVKGILNAPHRREAEEHLRNREWAKAIPHLDKLIEADPNFWPDLAARGDCYAELGDLKKALADYDQAVALDRAELAFNKLYWRHGLLCLALGDEERFRKVRARLVERFGESKNHEELWELAANCRFPQAGVDPARVLAWMEKAGPSFSKDSGFQCELGVAHFRAGKHAKALEHLKQAQELGVPVSFEAHISFYLALVHHHVERADEAHTYCDQGVEWFERFAEGDLVPTGEGGPTSWPTRMHLLLIRREVEALVKPPPPSAIGRFLREKRWADAVELLDRRLAADPKSILDLKTRALCHLELNAPDKAAADFARLAELQPDEPEWLCKQAVAHLAAGNRKAQSAVCDQLVDRFGVRDKPSMASRTAYACVMAPDGAVDPTLLVTIAQRGAGDFQGNERVHGAALYRAGKWAEALGRFEESAKKYEPRAWDFLFLAMIHQRLGHVKEARESLERANRWIAEANARPPSWGVGWGWWGERIEVANLLLQAEALLNEKPPAK